MREKQTEIDTGGHFLCSLIEETFLGGPSEKLSFSFLRELLTNSQLFSLRSDPPKYFIAAITELQLTSTRIALEV